MVRRSSYGIRRKAGIDDVLAMMVRMQGMSVQGKRGRPAEKAEEQRMKISCTTIRGL